MAITAFRGRWTKLGNYSLCTVFFEKHAYISTESAYQAAKFTDEWQQRKVREQPTPNMAKQMARQFEKYKHQRSDWHDGYKDTVMGIVLREKFTQEPERSILLSTGDEELIEGNYWHDNYWGDCRCGRPECESPGKNVLGLMLMQIRHSLQRGDLVHADSEVQDAGL